MTLDPMPLLGLILNVLICAMNAYIARRGYLAIPRQSYRFNTTLAVINGVCAIACLVRLT